LAVLLISIISGSLVYAYNSGLIHTDGTVIPDKGSLAVLAAYQAQANYVVVTVQVTGPQSTSGSTTTSPTSPLTFSDLPVGDYTVSGTYLSISKSSSVAVVKDTIVTVTLNFGDVPSGEFSFKKYHIIYTCLPVQGWGVSLTDAEIRGEAQQLKSLGFTTVSTYDRDCDLGIYDDNPTQYREYRAFQIFQEEGLYLIPQVGNWGSGEATATHLYKSALWMKNFPNLIGIYFDDMNAVGNAPSTSWIRQNFNIGRDYLIIFAVQDTYSAMSQYKGEHSFAFLSYYYSYYTNGMQSPPNGFKGTAWVQNAANTYGLSTHPNDYTAAPFLDCWEVYPNNGVYGTVDPAMWQPQVNVAMQNQMLMLGWFLWYFPTLGGLKTLPNAPPSGIGYDRTALYLLITQINHNYHAWLDSIS
jgi:hypothetical protein